MKEELKNEIEEIQQELKQKMNDISIEFATDFDITCSSYLCDAINEYADGLIDIYYSDLLEWAKYNYEYIEMAIEEFGDVARDNEKHVDFMRTIQQGQYLYNSNMLYEDEEKIVKLMMLNYLKKVADEINFEFDIEELIDEIAANFDHNERLNDLQITIDEYIKTKTEEGA